MICPRCSREMEGDGDICRYCGFTFRTPGAPAPAEAPAAAAAARPAPLFPEADSPWQATRTPVRAAPYQAPRTAASAGTEPVSTIRFIGMLLLSLVPVVGFVFFVIWAARRGTNENIRHFSAAILVMKAIGLIFILGAVLVYTIYSTPLFFYFFR